MNKKSKISWMCEWKGVHSHAAGVEDRYKWLEEQWKYIFNMYGVIKEQNKPVFNCIKVYWDFIKISKISRIVVDP